MTPEILKSNFNLLKSLHPIAYEAVKNSKPARDYEVTISQSGIPSLSYIKPNERKIHLLSKYDPLREAKNLIDSLDVCNYTNFIVLGIGLGYQISELIKSIPNYSKIIVIETDKNLARLAFETNDLSQILNHEGLTLAFPNNIKEITAYFDNEKLSFSLNGYLLVRQHSLTEVDPQKYNELLIELNSFFQAGEIELKTNSAKSKIFSNNIYKNFKNLVSSPGINEMKDGFTNIPAIICSAGPSLDKNIQLLKAKRENFLLISVATALKPLLKNGVSPDFVVAIDPDEITTQFFDLQNQMMSTWLVYDPVIPNVIPAFFKDKRLVYDSPIKLAQWLKTYLGENGSLGSVFSVAHAAYQFAKHVECSPIIFIGQDLSFTKKRLHSKNSYYYQQKEDLINGLHTMDYLDGQKFHKYSNNMLERKNIFNSPLTTTVAMDTYTQMFSSKLDNNSTTFNATEGGVGIKNIKNILLREAIKKYCPNNISTEKNKMLKTIQPKPFHNKEFFESAKKQLAFFKEISRQLNRLDSKFPKDLLITDQNKEGFVQEINSTIKELLKNNDATLLLQAYDFSGFSTWNRKTNDIMRRKSLGNTTSIGGEEFQRDQEFLKVLKNSVYFNINVFEDFVIAGSST